MPERAEELIGRQAELAAVRALVAAGRLTTITGPGGVGKSALLRALAKDLKRNYPGEVRLLDGDERDQIGELLASGELDEIAVLCLDHADAADATLSGLLNHALRATPGLRILVASRQPLGITAEQVYRLEPLALPPDAGSVDLLVHAPAVQYFLAHARQVLPRFEVNPANAASVRTIVSAVGGTPLGLQLAAQRLAVLSPEQLVDRLANLLHLLRQRGGEGRSASIRATVLWSYDACDADEQLLWRRLSIFTADFTVERVEDVCSDEHLDRWDVLDCLTGLIDKSIVLRDPGTALLRLPTSHREFAVEITSAEELAQARRRLAADLTQKAEEFAGSWLGPRQAEAMARLRSLRSELVGFVESAAAGADGVARSTAQTLLCTLADFWFAAGLGERVCAWGQELLRADPVDSNRLRLLVAQSAASTGRVELARLHLAAFTTSGSTPQSPTEHDAWVLAEALTLLWEGNAHAAVEALSPSLERALAQDPLAAQTWRFQALLLRGSALAALGRSQEAVRDHRTLLGLSQAVGESYYRSHALWFLALDQLGSQSPELADDLLAQAHRLKREVGDLWGTWLIAEALVWSRLMSHQVEEAMRLRAAINATVGTVEDLTVPIQVSWIRSRVLDLAQERGVGWDVATTNAASATADLAALLARVDTAVASALAAPSSSAPAQVELAQPHQAPQPEAAPGPGGSHAVAQRLLDSPLTKREREVVALIVEGLTNREIAARLVVSQKTAQGHVENILRKLGVRSRTQVAAWVAAGPDQQRKDEQGAPRHS